MMDYFPMYAPDATYNVSRETKRFDGHIVVQMRGFAPILSKNIVSRETMLNDNNIDAL